MLAREEYTPVPLTSTATAFPSGSTFGLATSEPTLIVFVHPLCPCTEATLHELKELLTDTSNKISVVIVFSIPTGLPANWKQGDLWRSVRSNSNFRIVQDSGGGEARRFGVNGSGHCLLYSSGGRLLFSGGITGSRGHTGENPGRLTLVALITTGHARISHTPVFGCSLL